VSYPLRWDDLDRVAPSDFTIHTALERLGGDDPWRDLMPAPQRLTDELVAEGEAIPVSRVQAMHEGKRRARARRTGTA
jgi:DNA primase